MRTPIVFPCRAAGAALVLSFLACGGAGAQYQLIRSTVYGSGGNSQSGNLSLQTTTSQPDAGIVAGGNFSLTGSFAKGDPASCIVLNPVAGVQASKTFCAGVRVTWIESGDGETGYRIYRDSVLRGATVAGVTAWIDSTAVSGMNYSYYVAAFDPCGEANPSNIDIGHKPLPPVAPTGVTITQLQSVDDSLHVQLAWSDHSPDEVRQVVYLMNPSPVALDSLPPHVQTATISLLQRGLYNYCFAISAEDCGFEARSDSACSVPIVSVALTLPKEFRLGPILGSVGPAPLHVLYEVPVTRMTSIEIYDVAGRQVRALVNGLTVPGRYSATWNGRDGRGSAAASGVYFVRMQAGSFKAVKRAVLLK